MNLLSECVQIIQKAKPGSRKYAKRYFLTQDTFLRLMKGFESRRSTPSAVEFECLHFAMRHISKCSNEHKAEYFGHVLPAAHARACIRTLIPTNHGIVGGGKGSIRDDLKSAPSRRRLWKLLCEIYHAKNDMAADAALDHYARHPVAGIQVGALSPFLWALRPKSYPIVNGGSVPGLMRLFRNFKKPKSLSQYVNETVPAVRQLAKVGGARNFAEIDRLCRLFARSKMRLPVAEQLPYDDWRIRTIEKALENERTTVLAIRRTRSRKLRESVLSERGYACEVCGFDFEKSYGVPFAEVHHIEPAAKANGPRYVQAHQLLVVCRNCHAMLHAPAFDLDWKKLKRIVGQRRAKR